MTAARALMMALYSTAYLVAVIIGASALDAGEDLYAAGLFGTSLGLLLGIHREARHAARLVRMVAAYRHGAPYAGAVDDLVVIEQATAVPLGCRCETWWTSLGDHHARQCPAAHARKDTR
ncbi:hypothetical protein ACFWXA_13145 [Streptomyces atroolivaceus]|uniref:hypothetical protein n=1 Tax=Streptomyces atroolivaceus TaxID=66869 RepID=UPI00365ED937